MAINPAGLVFTYAEPGPLVDVTLFNNWFENEYPLSRLNHQDIYTATSFQAEDSQPPSLLTFFDTKGPETVHTPEYHEIIASASETERQILDEIGVYQRRVYNLTSLWNHDTVGLPNEGNEIPAKYTLVVGLNLFGGEENEKELDDFYEQEHLALVAKIPGWVRARRYTLIESVEIGHDTGPIPTKFLGVQDFNLPGFMESEEMKAAQATPWAAKIGAIIKDQEMRSFVLYKNFEDQ